MVRYSPLGLIILMFAACIPYPGDIPDDGRGRSYAGIMEGVYPGLDAGAQENSSLHFKVKAYGQDAVLGVSGQAEAAYTRIMIDTGLNSFMPRGLYQVVVYGTQDEFRKKRASRIGPAAWPWATRSIPTSRRASRRCWRTRSRT